MHRILKEVLVKDVMADDFLVAYDDLTLYQAKNQLVQNYKKEIFIYDRQDNLKGVITIKDISDLYKDENLNISETPVIDFATKNIIGVLENASILESRDIMLENNIGRLAVMRKGKIVGIIREQHIIEFYYQKVESVSSIIKSMMDYMHEAVCIIDSKGVVVVWNDSAEKLYNLSKKEILGKHLGKFFPNAIDLEILKTGEVIKNIYHKPREGTHIVISAAPIRVNNKIVGVISTDNDVSEVKELSSKLKEAMEKADIFKYKLEEISNEKNRFVIGNSKIVKKELKIAELAAKSNAPILILGESGTGKEVFAKYIHEASGVEGELISVNCGAIPTNLFESEFFGYEGGAFTGAREKGKAGYFQLANNGTLFLDEIGDCPMEMQSKLLRALQECRVRKVGSEKDIELNVRIISATNRDLEELIRKEKFRKDLYYRLDVISITVPPLRERKEDIILFIKFFIEELNKEYDKNITGMDPKAVDILVSYNWEGNIRELKNIMERMVVLCRGDFISKEMLPRYIVEDIKNSEYQGIINGYTKDKTGLKYLTDEYEKKLICNALRDSNGNIAKAANILKIPRSTLHYKLDNYQISVNKLT